MIIQHEESSESMRLKFEEWFEKNFFSPNPDIKPIVFDAWVQSALIQIKLSENKKKILKSLTKYWLSLHDLSVKTGLSIPLSSYHIRGNVKYAGLYTYGFVETKLADNQLFIRLTDVGLKLERFEL